MTTEKEWHGHERRHTPDRRVQHERREEIRFEPGKKDRRHNRGRRSGDSDLWEKAMREDD
ncbi:hypothetical protein [Marinobacterium lutimaris]|uniref:Uncharacterized protein n=1 Tax=Marinobacterium lutimaris TaxID=568106 RepID=A0A1H5YFA9_9GAMM|nr:hypothetical protein [Marinobacterium lutimaris]SEG22799.1 hypothetical protein SAMN05444390_1011740 [Marinobacterium lutimaris]